MKTLHIGHTATLHILKSHTLLSTTVLDSADTDVPITAEGCVGQCWLRSSAV